MILTSTRPQAFKARHRRGFTLVEIIVAGIIMSMLFGAIAVSGVASSLSSRARVHL